MPIIVIAIAAYAFGWPAWVPVVGILAYLLHVEIQSSRVTRSTQSDRHPDKH